MKIRLYTAGTGVIHNPENNGIRFLVDLNKAENLDPLKSLHDYPGRNPRTTDPDNPVARTIESSLETNPLFGETNMGFSVVAESYKEGRNDSGHYVDLIFDHIDLDEGNFNGGHSIAKGVGYIRKKDQYDNGQLSEQDDEFAPNPGAYLFAQTIIRDAFDDPASIRKLANDKNTTVSIQTMSELNVLERFQDLKESIDNDLATYIMWEQNQCYPGTNTKMEASASIKEVTQILQMFMFHFDDVEYDILTSRKSIGASLAKYFTPGNKEAESLAKCFQVSGDLLMLRDHLLGLMNEYGASADGENVIILRNVAKNKPGQTLSTGDKFDAACGGMGETTVRTIGYFSKKDTASYSTTSSLHRIFLLWFVRNCFRCDKETDSLMYVEGWTFERMTDFMDFSFKSLVVKVNQVYQSSYRLNGCRDEDWILQKFGDKNKHAKPFEFNLANTDKMLVNFKKQEKQVVLLEKVNYKARSSKSVRSAANG